MKTLWNIFKSLFVVLVGLAGIGLITWLLYIGKLQSVDFRYCLFAIMLLSVVMFVIDRLKEFDLKNSRIVLTEMKEVQADIYVKVETIKSLAEDIADTIVISATDKIPQFPPQGSPDGRYEREFHRLRTRDRVISILKSVDCDEQKIDEAKKAFDAIIRAKLMVLFRLFLHTWVSHHLQDLATSRYSEITKKREKVSSSDKLAWQSIKESSDKVEEELKRLREYCSPEKLNEIIDSTNCDLKKIEEYLKAKDVWDDKIANHLSTFQKFLDDHNFDMRE